MQLPAGSRNGYKPYRWANGDEDTAGRLWFLLPGQVEPELAVSMCDVSEYYFGVGRAFGDRPQVRVGRTRTLVTQRVGLDV